MFVPTRVFLPPDMVTSSIVSGLPLGIFITLWVVAECKGCPVPHLVYGTMFQYDLSQAARVEGVEVVALEPSE